MFLLHSLDLTSLFNEHLVTGAQILSAASMGKLPGILLGG